MADLKLGSASETIVIATFANRHAAEKMLLALGRDFRKKARKASTTTSRNAWKADECCE